MKWDGTAWQNGFGPDGSSGGGDDGPPGPGDGGNTVYILNEGGGNTPTIARLEESAVIGDLVFEDDVLKDIVIEISENRLGATAVCDDKKYIVGMITDGDLRRCFENNTELSNLKAKEMMTKSPKKINSQSLVYDAFKIMKS